MERKRLLTLAGSVLLVLVLAACSAPAVPTEPTEPPVTPGDGSISEVREWKLVNPEGVTAVEPIEIAPRLNTLEGKTVALRWNGKPNGDVLLDRIAELLTAEVPTVNIIKLYEVEPSTTTYASTVEAAAEMAKVVESYHPDLVIGSQCD